MSRACSRGEGTRSSIGSGPDNAERADTSRMRSVTVRGAGVVEGTGSETPTAAERGTGGGVGGSGPVLAATAPGAAGGAPTVASDGAGCLPHTINAAAGRHPPRKIDFLSRW